MENYIELVAEYQIKIRDKSLTPTERMNAIIKLQRYSMFIDLACQGVATLTQYNET